MAGHVPVHSLAVRRTIVMHRSDDRQMVRQFRQSRRMLADVNAGRGRVDWLELAANVGGRFRFGIERVDVAHPAPAEQHDARLR